MLVIAAIKTTPAERSFAIFTIFEYLFLYNASSANSITELNSSAVITKLIDNIKTQYSIHLKLSKIPPTIAKKPTSRWNL